MTGSRRYKAFTEGGWSAAVTESDYQPILDNYFKAQCMDAFFFFCPDNIYCCCTGYKGLCGDQEVVLSQREGKRPRKDTV